MEATAWAIKENGQINVRSIMDTPVGAMVNWLSTDGGLTVGRFTSDNAVEFLFQRRAQEMGRLPMVIEVTIHERQQ